MAAAFFISSWGGGALPRELSPCPSKGRNVCRSANSIALLVAENLPPCYNMGMAGCLRRLGGDLDEGVTA